MNRVLMNAELRVAILAIALLALAGCKTTESAATAKPSPATSQGLAAQDKSGSTYDPRIVEDKKYVSHVERLALRRGVSVRWVNKPHKRIVDQASSGSSQ